MSIRSALKTVATLTAISLLGVGCAARTINKIQADPTKYADKEVRIEGRVTESYSVLGKGAYLVDDGTGRLWVVSQEGVPRQGSRVQVKGKVKDGFNLGSLVTLPKNLGSGLVMIESSHKAKD